MGTDDIDVLNIPTEIPDSTPEQSFHYAWISDLLDRVLCEVKNECLKADKEIHWKVFNDKIIEPIVKSIDSPTLKDICSKYAINDEKKASNMIITVRRRLRKSLERCMRQFAHSDSQVAQEIAEMLKIFSK